MQHVTFEFHRDYKVIREDLYEGGTKRRALLEWLPTLKAKHFSYTGSVFGYGAYALALACEDLNFECSLYISKNKYIPLWADKVNAVWCNPAPLSELKNIALQEHPKAYFLEAGFLHDGFEQALINVFKNNKPNTQRVWTSVVSGTIVRAMAQAWPDIEIQAVCCVKHHGPLPSNVKLYYAPEKYHQSSKILPPYPSALHTDAKIWQFIEQHGQKGDAIWNLAA